MANPTQAIAGPSPSPTAPASPSGDAVLDAEGLQDFISNGLDCMHQVDADGVILWANQAELDLLGFTRDEYLGRNVAEVHADADVLAGMFAALREGRQVRNQRTRLRAKDGTLHTVLVNSNGVYDEAGRFVRSRCFSHEIDALVRTEDLLHARERQQAAVARLGHLALVGTDLQPLFDAAVREVADTLGVRHVGLCGLLGDRRFRFEAAVGFDEALGKVGPPAEPGGQADYMLATKSPVVSHDVRAETRFRVSSLVLDKGIVSGMTVLVPARNGPWGILGAHSTVARTFSPDDINFLESVGHVLGNAIGRKAFEEELQRSRTHLEIVVAERTRQLAASNEELEAFSASASHDLRAPLRTILGYSTLLASKHGDELGQESKVLVEGVRSSAERLGRLVDDLLELSRVQRVDLVRQRVDLSALAGQVLARLAAGEPDRHVVCHVEPGLSAAGDPHLLAMLLDNLLGNAWKFTRRTAGARIAVGQQGDGDRRVFTVQDNGAGFDMIHAGKLFQPFQRLHHASEFEGTGIGLATVHRIVTRHQGRVWAEARPGAGARFHFTLGGHT